MKISNQPTLQEDSRYNIRNIILIVTVLLLYFIYLTLYWLSFSQYFRFPDLKIQMLLFLVQFFFLFFTIFTVLDKKKREKIFTNYNALKELRELEATHYKEIEQRRMQLEEFKTSYQSQISSICDALSDGDFSKAQTLSATLSERVSKTKEFPFCNEPIINAVLSEKQTQCLANSIALFIDLPVIDVSSIQKVHLCSVFTNLLDNAIHACCKLPTETERYIRIRAHEHASFLHIKVTNSALPPVKKTSEGHGFGQKILNDIAKAYHGEFYTEYHSENQTYDAAISLQLTC